MCSLQRSCIVAALCLLSGPIAFGQEDKNYSMVSFDEKGKLEDAKAWASLKDDLAARKPKHVFLICHGWLTSKNRADKTYTYFGEELRKLQGKDEPIEVIGVRWPSLIGENDTEEDRLFNDLVKRISDDLGKFKAVKEQKKKLKSILKNGFTQFAVSQALKFQLPADEQIDSMIDNFEEPENIKAVLSSFTYYEMKRRAGDIGIKGLAPTLTELQDRLPNSRIHLVGHSFGCKVCLECLASEGRAKKTVDSVTLLQGAVSMFCFASKVDDLEGKPAGAYADVPARVKGPIVVTFTKNDKALTVAYVAASHAAGQIAELPARKFQLNPERYGALGGKGILGVAELEPLQMNKMDSAYKLRAGLNPINADNVIQDHNDYRRGEVTALLWAAARDR